MKLMFVLLTMVLLAGPAAAAAEGCDVPSSLGFADGELTHVAAAITDRHRLDITVIGSGSSTLPGPEGAHYAYPARLEEALKNRLTGIDVHVSAHVKARETTAEMAAELPKIIADEKPALVIWQAGTADAIRGVEPDDFRAKLDDGIDALQGHGADVILMNMQYSPRTESMLGITAYADVMRWEAQQRGAPLFDRLALMRYWNEEGLFDLYSATKDYAMARKVHDCIGRALASLIVDASHIDALKLQTKR
jgi:lysophospholipase L1-like esterase